MGNHFKTAILLAVMMAFMMWIGQMLGGSQGMVFALILATAINFFSYWYSDKIVLKMYRAKEVTHQQAPEIYAIVRDLTQRANLPMPKVYIIPQQAPNAFATGRNPEHAAVAVTEGLLNLLNKEEIKGVLAHELAHVNNRDILIGSIAATMAGAIMMVANMTRWFAIFGGASRDDGEDGNGGILGLIVMSILAPIAAVLIQTAISRSREYLADATGAKLTHHPEGLASALEKLGAYSKRIPMEVNPSTAHMFIVNPLSGRNLMNLFSTHPPLEERITRLRGTSPTHIFTDNSKDRRLKEGKDFWNRLS